MLSISWVEMRAGACAAIGGVAKLMNMESMPANAKYCSKFV